jgi:hypothetical protein
MYDLSFALFSAMPLSVGMLLSTYSLMPFSTLLGVRWAFGGLLLTSLKPMWGTCLARSSCAMLFMGLNCFQ